jgi:hypothetical protein
MEFATKHWSKNTKMKNTNWEKKKYSENQKNFPINLKI